MKIKLIDWYENPKRAKTLKDWDQWHKDTKNKYPVQYFFRRTLVQLIRRKLRNVKMWVIYRTISRYHIIHTGLKPGYYDPGERILHGMFYTFVHSFYPEWKRFVAMGLDADYELSQEIELLYIFWTNRKNPWDIEDIDESKRARDLDGEMAVRLAKILNQLWT